MHKPKTNQNNYPGRWSFGLVHCKNRSQTLQIILSSHMCNNYRLTLDFINKISEYFVASLNTNIPHQEAYLDLIYVLAFLKINSYIIPQRTNVVLKCAHDIDTLMMTSFGCWRGGMNELQEFTSLLNDKDSNLDRVHFLDMWVEKKSGTLCTTLHRKDTDRNTLLLANSYHPTPLK